MTIDAFAIVFISLIGPLVVFGIGAFFLVDYLEERHRKFEKIIESSVESVLSHMHEICQIEAKLYTLRRKNERTKNEE